MRRPDERKRPGRAPRTLPDDSTTTTKSGYIVPRTVRPSEDLDAVAAHVDGTFVLVVKLSGGKYRRRCFLTAKAAENAARRATDRGESATVYLAELKPLFRIDGGA